MCVCVTQLGDIEVKEAVERDERAWGLWHEHRGTVRKITLQARSVLLKLSWLKDLRDLQQRSSLSSRSESLLSSQLSALSSGFWYSNMPCHVQSSK